MKHSCVYLIACCTVHAASASADHLPWNGPGPRGPIVVDHPPLNSGGGGSDTAFRDMFGTPVWQRVADDFTLAAPADIRRITWWGFYDQNNPPATETMRIRFYGARPGDGLPDENNILFEQSYLNPSRIATGRQIGVGIAPDEIRYEVDVAGPIQLGANTPYWLEVVQIGDLDTHFRWEFSLPDGRGLAFINPNVPDWQETAFDANAAFQLSTIPEPTTGMLCLMAGGILAGVSRRKEAERPMNHSLPRIVWAFLVLSASGTSLNADAIPWHGPSPRGPVVAEHLPTQAGGPSSDTEFLDPFGQPAWQRLADEVILTAPATIRRLAWWGFYDQNNPPATETIRIRFYAARPGDGLPDENNILFGQSYLDPSRIATGRQIGVGIAPDEFLYEVYLLSPLTLNAGATYWLEVVQIGDISTAFRWEFGANPLINGHAFANSIVGDWRHTTNTVSDQAFQLWTIPEPASALPFLAVVVACSRAGRRKEVERRMNHFLPRIVWAFLVLSAYGTSLNADPIPWNAPSPRGPIVVDHQPVQTGGGGSDTLFVNNFGQTTWQRIADDFTLAAPADIRRITWWGFYNLNNPPAIETMRIRFYGARSGDGLPDENNILFDHSFLNPLRVATGRRVGVGIGPDEFRYEVEPPTPVLLVANATHWLEIVQIGDIDTAFRWEFSLADQNGQAFINPNVGEWRRTVSIVSDTAFQLSTIPEPTTGMLYLMAGGILAGVSRRKQAP